jgi:hypothetical protein
MIMPWAASVRGDQDLSSSTRADHFSSVDDNAANFIILLHRSSSLQWSSTIVQHIILLNIYMLCRLPISQVLFSTRGSNQEPPATSWSFTSHTIWFMSTTWKLTIREYGFSYTKKASTHDTCVMCKINSVISFITMFG